MDVEGLGQVRPEVSGRISYAVPGGGVRLAVLPQPREFAGAGYPVGADCGHKSAALSSGREASSSRMISPRSSGLAVPLLDSLARSKMLARDKWVDLQQCRTSFSVSH